MIQLFLRIDGGADMSYWEIGAGIALIIACVVLIGIILAQEAKGQGLSSVITGQAGASDESRLRGKDARQVRVTRIVAIVFFVLTLVVNFASVFTG